MPRNAKQQAIEMIQRLPQDASMEDVMRQIHPLTKVQRGPVADPGRAGD
jgi:hypothetical protein